MIVWITGISGSGKTTIAKALVKKLKPKIPHLFNVDGDEVRELFGEDLGYTERDRMIQIKRIQRLCHLLEKQNQVVIASALYSNKDLLKWNRENFSEYYEIYLNAPLALVKERDVKGLYKKYENGDEKNIIGLDIPWHEPKNPDLKIDCSGDLSLDEVIQKIINLIPKFKETL